MYKDLNGDGKISSGDGTLNDLGDLKVVANTQLRFKYGLTLDASWKGFDFSAFFQGVGKRDVVVGGPYFWGANGQECGRLLLSKTTWIISVRKIQKVYLDRM